MSLRVPWKSARWHDDRVRIQGEPARVLITVKTTPMPSASYGDTVCVAGIRLDTGTPHWIRLYPIPFRWLDESQQFGKYEIVELDVSRRHKDTRPESYTPIVETIRRVKRIEGWSARQIVFEDLPRTTTCALRQGAHDSPSLGMVRVRALQGHRFEPHPGWTPQEQARIARSMDVNVSVLFGQAGRIPPKLAAPKWKLTYRYLCEDPDCRGHDGQVLDWELTMLERHAAGSLEDKKEAIRKKFVDMMFAPSRETSFFMGNFEAATKRRNFSVLGVYYPPVTVATSARLF